MQDEKSRHTKKTSERLTKIRAEDDRYGYQSKSLSNDPHVILLLHFGGRLSELGVCQRPNIVRHGCALISVTYSALVLINVTAFTKS